MKELEFFLPVLSLPEFDHIVSWRDFGLVEIVTIGMKLLFLLIAIVEASFLSYYKPSLILRHPLHQGGLRVHLKHICNTLVVLQGGRLVAFAAS